MSGRIALSLFIAAMGLCACTGEAPAQRTVAGDPFYYDAYYDGAYGAFVDGYWGGDGAFWYMDADHAWHRDSGGHFHHEPTTGADPVHGGTVDRD